MAAVVPGTGSAEERPVEPMDGLRALAEALIGPFGHDQALAGPADPVTAGQLVLRLDELLADDRGEIVLTPGDGVCQLVIEATQDEVNHGASATQSGSSIRDVDGMSCMTLGSGTVIYFPSNLEVSIVSSVE